MNNITQHMLYNKLLAEFHPTLNLDKKLSDFTFGSKKKVWWRCGVADDHEWEARINHRINGVGCPYCNNKKVTLSNCLATTHPDIALKWHPIKNNNITPYDITFGVKKKFWWKCDVYNDHEWQSLPLQLVKNNGCACCAGRVAVVSNCLATTHPEIANKWHPIKNKDLTPHDVTYGSEKKVWWTCDKEEDHEWECSIINQVNRPGCSCCSGKIVVKSNCLNTTHPELSMQWHTKNILTPYDVTAGSNKKVWWQCENNKEHVWYSVISSRAGYKKAGCPECNESKGELKIKQYLIENSIKFETQKRFNDCKYKKTLPFDFYLKEYNILIEYDGIQHYESIYFMGGEKNLEESKKKDKIKTEYAKNNNIKLLRIPYTEFNRIETIMSKYLSNNYI